MAIIVVLYVLIGLALRRSSSISNTNSSASHHHSPHHLCGQAAVRSPHPIQRSNNSILLDNSSSPTTTLIYNDSKSVTFCTNGKQNSRTNALIDSGEQLDAKSDQLRSDQQTKLNNFLNKNDKDLNSLRNSLSSPSALKSMRPFNGGGLKSSLDEHELIELNNNQPNGKPTPNQPNSKPSAPLLLSIQNGTTLAAHRPSDLLTNSHPAANVSATINSTLNSSAFNSCTLGPANNHNLNSAISPTVNSAITPTAVAIPAGNSIHHHHRHHQAAASRRSVIKMLGKPVAVAFVFGSQESLGARNHRKGAPAILLGSLDPGNWAKHSQFVFMKCEFFF